MFSTLRDKWKGLVPPLSAIKCALTFQMRVQKFHFSMRRILTEASRPKPSVTRRLREHAARKDSSCNAVSHRLIVFQ
jgi:hypothetical protein